MEIAPSQFFRRKVLISNFAAQRRSGSGDGEARQRFEEYTVTQSFSLVVPTPLIGDPSRWMHYCGRGDFGGRQGANWRRRMIIDGWLGWVSPVGSHEYLFL